MNYKSQLIFLCALLMFFGCSKEKEDVQLPNQMPASDFDMKSFCDLLSITYSNCALNIRDSVVLFCNGDILMDSVYLYSLNNDKMDYTHGLKFSHEDGGKIVVVNEILHEIGSRCADVRGASANDLFCLSKRSLNGIESYGADGQ